MEEKKGFFDLLSQKQALAVGLITGFLVLCTIGFFILLAYVLSGNVSKDGKGEELDVPKEFSKCLDTSETKTLVSADQQLGASLGVRGTPATFINGYLVSGALPYEMIKQVIDALLQNKEPDFDFLKDESGKIVKADVPDLGDIDWRGNKNGKITMISFSDFECPYCARFAPTVEQVLNEYNEVKFAFKHFPLSFHANAQKAAESFECAKKQGKGWEMHDKLFGLNNAGQINFDNFKKAAGELELD